MSESLGIRPYRVRCPSCNSQVMTNVEFVSSYKTHLIAILLCIIGLCPCAACLYCTSCARDAYHYCPVCDTLIGIHER